MYEQMFWVLLAALVTTNVIWLSLYSKLRSDLNKMGRIVAHNVTDCVRYVRAVGPTDAVNRSGMEIGDVARVNSITARPMGDGMYEVVCRFGPHKPEECPR